MMDSWGELTSAQKAALAKGRLNASDVMLSSSQDIARKCKISAAEAQSIIDHLYLNTSRPQLLKLEDADRAGCECFTTGDPVLDGALGGGIRAGMIWEVVGESAAGKTQLALQLSLSVQLPLEKKGLHGSTCYITTSSTLPTSRLVDMVKTNVALDSRHCDLKDIHTLSALSSLQLLHILSDKLTPFINSRSSEAGFKPVKLLVIDALAELFHTSAKTTAQTLVERSRNIAQISFLLHNIARTHKLAIVVINEVVDVFDRVYLPNTGSPTLSYSEQSRWFNRAHSIPQENMKEASLGMVWANQINTRIMLSRTGRRRYLDDVDPPFKRLKTNTDFLVRPATIREHADLTSIRRLSIVFSSVMRPASLDYIVTDAGISCLSEDHSSVAGESQTTSVTSLVEDPRLELPMTSAQRPHQNYPLDVGVVEDWAQEGTSCADMDEEPPKDEWDDYWASNTMSQVELEALNETLF
ncbi:hypothetical protein H0H93_007174 [Arthromyces matolae]|nr:hypothetical protein H0H93_007174 [Arthromyces matolae]